MTIKQEISLRNFEFWSGAKYTAEVLTPEQIDTIETYLEDLYPDGASDTDINDIFWFERDMLAEWLGFEDWEALERANKGEGDDDDDEDDNPD